jgi:hypothetical protein
VRSATCIAATDGGACTDSIIAAEVMEYFDTRGVERVAMVDRVFGCPREVGLDYEGEYCPV